MTEAWLLSIYFEETGAYQYKKNKEMENSSGSTSSGGDVTLLSLSDDDPKQAVYMEFEEND